MLHKYLSQILKLYNYVDGILLTDDQGRVEYFITYRSDVNSLKAEDVEGKHLFEIYPDLTEETSSIMRVLRSGEPIFNEYQTLKTVQGQSIKAINTTFPISSGNKIIGAVDISRYVEPSLARKEISVSLKASSLRQEQLFGIDDIETQDPRMISLKSKILQVAITNSPVLIYGQTGTGKELIAQSLHKHSQRENAPFVSQNCAAIPSTLLESILFGTVRGSYTGAEDRPGLFESADGGTLFLDEINAMEMPVQAKLLKVIEEHSYRRLGSNQVIRTNLRIVTAVNEDPWEAIRNGRLREDLFYRIGVVQFSLPTLKERQGDVELLCSLFIDKYNKRMNKKILGVSEKVARFFAEYAWPGNVRELKNVIEGAFNIVQSQVITMEDLPEYMLLCNRTDGDNISGKSLDEALKQFELKLLNDAISNSESLTEAAEKLKISKQLLHYKMKKYRLVQKIENE